MYKTKLDVFMEVVDLIVNFALVALMIFSYMKGCYHLMQLSGFMAIWFALTSNSDRYNYIERKEDGDKLLSDDEE